MILAMHDLSDTDPDHQGFEPDEIETSGGGIVAIVLLIVAILLLVFIFRDELGLGTPTATIEIPERIEIEESDVETAPTDALEPGDATE